MSFLDTASAWLDDVLDEHETVAVRIRRGSLVAENVPAERGRSQRLQENDDGSFTTVETRDYLIAVDAYAFGGNKTAPASGDLIEEDQTEATLIYQLRPALGEPAARHVDVRRKKWRCHVLLKEEEPTASLLGDENGRVLTDENGFPFFA